MIRSLFVPLLAIAGGGVALSSWSVESGVQANPACEIVITDPGRDNAQVGREMLVRGTASLRGGDHLWVLVRRQDFEPLWWPQREAKVDPRTREWRAMVVFGGPQDIGSVFDIAAIFVSEAEHARLMEYWERAMATGDWRPRRMPPTTCAPQIRRVTKIADSQVSRAGPPHTSKRTSSAGNIPRRRGGVRRVQSAIAPEAGATSTASRLCYAARGSPSPRLRCPREVGLPSSESPNGHGRLTPWRP